MTKIRAIDIAKWFIKHGYDTPRNTFDGNMKLQKLLFFSQLIHLAKFDKLLFSEEMRAYENGTVINDVRLPYKTSLYFLLEQAKQLDDSFDEDVEQTLNLTVELFGNMTARELSKLNHELRSWKLPYNESKTNIPNVYNTEKNIIDIFNGGFIEDINKVKHMIDAYEKNDDTMDFEVINGVTFYYNSNEMQLTEEVLEMLGSYDYPEETYIVTYDEDQGIIIS